LTTRRPSKRSRRAIKKDPSRAKRGGAIVNAHSRDTSVLNDAQSINVAISTNTSASGKYTRVDTYRDKPVWSCKFSDKETSYVYYDTEDKLTIGIFDNLTPSELSSLLTNLNGEPYDGRSVRLTDSGWKTGRQVDDGPVDTEFIWHSTDKNIEIRTI
jgi:hypothetical protein